MSRATLILLSLVAGLATGVGIAAVVPGAAGPAVAVAEPLGTAWLHALQMTVVPLVVALLVTGVAQTAAAAGAGRVTARMIGLILVVAVAMSTTGALVTPLILEAFPVPAEAAASLRRALVGAMPVTSPPPLAEFFKSVVPTNVLAAAGSDQFLSLILFTLLFAFAVTRIAPDGRDRIVGLFAAIRDAMLVLIDWILTLAPLGVFALALVVGARAGTAAFGALIHYVVVMASVGVLVMLLAYLLGGWGGRVGVVRFGRALVPVQAVAISTQSSLACLPAMLAAAESLGVRRATAGVALPLAVAMFRATQPAMNVAVSVYIAHWFGIAIDPAKLAAAVVVAVLVSLGSVSLPAQITFFASVAPPAIALGVPIAPLGLLIAVETIPDIFRTLGNASMDLAATVTVSAMGGERSAPELNHEVPQPGS